MYNKDSKTSSSKTDVLAEAIIDKLRQSLKRDLDGNVAGDGTTSGSTASLKNGCKQSCQDNSLTSEISTSYPHKSKRKPPVKYNGLTEKELGERHLPDHLVLNLDIIIVGLNPSLQSVFKGHHYAGPGHHFWKCIYASGIVPQAMNACEDYRLPQFGVGFTNVVSKATKSASDLTKEEINDGRVVLIQKIKLYKPKIVVLVGKSVFDIFYTSKNFCYGKQALQFPESNSFVFVIPSATGCGSSYWPRVQDKLPFFKALRKLRDYVKGNLPNLNDDEVIFPIASAANSLHNGSLSSLNQATSLVGNGVSCPTNSQVPRKSQQLSNQISCLSSLIPISPNPSSTKHLVDSNAKSSNMLVHGEDTVLTSNLNLSPLVTSSEFDDPSENNHIMPVYPLSQKFVFWSSPSPLQHQPDIVDTTKSTFNDDLTLSNSPSYKISPRSFAGDGNADNSSDARFCTVNEVLSSTNVPTIFQNRIPLELNVLGSCKNGYSSSHIGSLNDLITSTKKSSISAYNHTSAHGSLYQHVQKDPIVLNQHPSISNLTNNTTSTSYPINQKFVEILPLKIGNDLTGQYGTFVQNDMNSNFMMHQNQLGGDMLIAYNQLPPQLKENSQLANSSSDANKVLFEYHEICISPKSSSKQSVSNQHNCPYQSHQPFNAVNSSGEFTKLYFLDDEYSCSTEPVLRQLISASDL